MGMGIGVNSQQPDEGEIKGRQEEVACYVWFTSRGAAIPKMIKFQGADGEIYTLPHIHVRSSTQKNYCGIPTLVYECDAVIAMQCYQFCLLYYIEKQEWKILWK